MRATSLLLSALLASVTASSYAPVQRPMTPVTEERGRSLESGPGESSGDSVAIAAGLRPLRETSLPPGSREIRIWIGGGIWIPEDLYRIRIDAKQVQGEFIRYWMTETVPVRSTGVSRSAADALLVGRDVRQDRLRGEFRSVRHPLHPHPRLGRSLWTHSSGKRVDDPRSTRDASGRYRRGGRIRHYGRASLRRYVSGLRDMTIRKHTTTAGRNTPRPLPDHSTHSAHSSRRAGNAKMYRGRFTRGGGQTHSRGVATQRSGDCRERSVR